MKKKSEFNILSQMAATRRQVRGSFVIETYDELKKRIELWAKGEAEKTLIIYGRAGTLKTTAAEQAIIGFENFIVKGDATPLAIYENLYQHRDELIVFDDVKFTKAHRNVLLQIWETKDKVVVRWHKAGKMTDDMPNEFMTSSKSLIITNDFEKLKSMTGILSRCRVFEFEPTTPQMLDEAKFLVENGVILKSVWEWSKQHEKLLWNLDVRDLVNASKEKYYDPIEMLHKQYLSTETELGAYMYVIAAYKTTDERKQKWGELTTKSEAEFFRCQKEYRDVFPTKKLPRGRSAKRKGQS